MKSNPKLREIITAYFFVGLTIAILVYGIYLLFSSSIEDKMKDYEERKKYREQSDKHAEMVEKFVQTIPNNYIRV